MQTQFVRHVRYIILRKLFLGDDGQRSRLILVERNGRPLETSFREAAFENLHDTVRVCVAV